MLYDPSWMTNFDGDENQALDVVPLHLQQFISGFPVLRTTVLFKTQRALHQIRFHIIVLRHKANVFNVLFAINIHTIIYIQQLFTIEII